MWLNDSTSYRKIKYTFTHKDFINREIISFSSLLKYYIFQRNCIRKNETIFSLLGYAHMQFSTSQFSISFLLSNMFPLTRWAFIFYFFIDGKIIYWSITMYLFSTPLIFRESEIWKIFNVSLWLNWWCLINVYFVLLSM